MALVPRLLRPSALLRRKAMYSGFLGNSTFWKLVGVVVYGKRTLKRLLGSQPEVIDVSRLGPGRAMSIVTAEPMTRRRRRALARRGVAVATIAEQTVLAERWASRQAARKAS